MSLKTDKTGKTGSKPRNEPHDVHIQDWDPAIIRAVKSKEEKRAEDRLKPKFSRETQLATVKVADDGTEDMKLKTVSLDMARFIVGARVGKKMKQDELAKMANLNVNTLSTIERGGGVYNPDHINRIARALGINIPRK